MFIHFDGCCVMNVHAHVCACLCVFLHFSAPVSVGKVYRSPWDEVKRLWQYWVACLPPSLWQDPTVHWGIHKDVDPLFPKESSVSTSHLAIWVLREYMCTPSVLVWLYKSKLSSSLEKKMLQLLSHLPHSEKGNWEKSILYTLLLGLMYKILNNYLTKILPQKLYIYHKITYVKVDNEW